MELEPELAHWENALEDELTKHHSSAEIVTFRTVLVYGGRETSMIETLENRMLVRFDFQAFPFRSRTASRTGFALTLPEQGCAFALARKIPGHLSLLVCVPQPLAPTRALARLST